MTSHASPWEMSECVYLDANATTPAAPEVVEAMLPFLLTQFGNASSGHRFGRDVLQAIKAARQKVQALIGAEHDDEIIFTSGGTEADATAISSAVKAQPDRDRIIITALEHPAVRAPCEQLRKDGYDVQILPVDPQGGLDLDAFQNLLTPRVALVSAMWANNETGHLLPVARMAEMARERGILFHTDAVQAVGKIPISLKDSAIDMLSLSGHKFFAPKGIGALYLRRGARFRPLLRGGRQENGRRAGTENTPGIVGLGKAAELAAAHFTEDGARMERLRDRLERALLAVPDSLVIGAGAPRLPNTSAIAFAGVASELLLPCLDQAGIAASSGSACSSGTLEPSHVLRALGVPQKFARGVVRFSLSRATTETEIDHVIAVVPQIVAQMRAGTKPVSGAKHVSGH
ncbi:cysteine desulfurase [Rhodoblastus acidophilus]|uniref:cysteine desulfurase NifS n=1 Tax=Rhodoblastus acidophilus TaxID=1074 RepID=UPI002224C1C2|nr:cysteine desulfurase NifS [Rhodoblastus acidophilus]MCW2285431.1 cysteine desulfurase [Rhodoblastus acidophilus]MCW2334320.1 cysteine desulfurase [Rhodoblastus acidophilus]